MAHIKVNFDDVPDSIQPIDPGVYTLVVTEASVEATKDGKGEKVVVAMKIDDEASPNHGRSVYDHLSLKLPIGLKRLAKSAGLTLGSDGLDTSELVGKHIRARIKARTYKDPESGEVKETSSIADYLFE